MSTRHRLCGFDDLSSGQVRRFDVEGRPIALVRVHDSYHAVGDTCTHQRISLSEGEVHVDTCELECWKHGSRFSLIDGTPHSLPATKPVPVYELEVAGGDVVVVIR